MVISLGQWHFSQPYPTVNNVNVCVCVSLSQFYTIADIHVVVCFIVVMQTLLLLLLVLLNVVRYFAIIWAHIPTKTSIQSDSINPTQCTNNNELLPFNAMPCYKFKWLKAPALKPKKKTSSTRTIFRVLSRLKVEITEGYIRNKIPVN